MTIVKLWTDTDAEKPAHVKAIVDDMRAVRGTGLINNFWRGLTLDKLTFERTWQARKEVMVAPSALDNPPWDFIVEALQ